MKKTIRFMLYAAVAAATVSCAEEIAPEKDYNNSTELIPMTFSAGSEEVDSKITLQEDGLTLHWDNTDQIKVFDGTSNTLPAFTTTGSGLSVDFTGGVEDAEAETYYALYPYQADAEFRLDESASNRPTIYAEVPTVQTAVAGNVPSNAFIAVAKSDNHNNFSFKTICGYLKFTLNQDNVKSITFSGNDNESLTGKIKIYYENGTAKQTYVSGEVYPTVTLEGNLVNGETYYAAIRGTSFKKGMTVSLLYKDGTRSYITTDVAPSNGLSANSVMNIASPASFNTERPDDNFLAYIHGYDMDLPEGVSYKEVKLVDETQLKDNETLGSKLKSYMTGSVDRIVFISSIDESQFEITSTVGMKKNIAVIGRYNSKKPTIKTSTTNVYFRHIDGSFLMRNVIVDASSVDKYIFNHANSTADYGEFIIDGCWIKGMAKKVWQNAEKHAYGVKKIIFKNNKVEICADDVSIFNFYRPTVSANLEITNNIFYGALNTDGTEKDYENFKIVNHSATEAVTGLELDNIILNNNSFVNLYFNKQGYVNANKIVKAEVKSNLLSVPNYVSIVGTNYWGILFAYGRKEVTGSGTTYDTFVQYADMNAEETQTVTAKEGGNPNYYPAQNNITVQYNTAYRIKAESGDRYPKASFLDLKLRDEVFCPKGSFYKNVANPSAVNEEVFATKDFANGIFIQGEKYADKGAKIN